MILLVEHCIPLSMLLLYSAAVLQRTYFGRRGSGMNHQHFKRHLKTHLFTLPGSVSYTHLTLPTIYSV